MAYGRGQVCLDYPNHHFRLETYVGQCYLVSNEAKGHHHPSPPPVTVVIVVCKSHPYPLWPWMDVTL